MEQQHIPSGQLGEHLWWPKALCLEGKCLREEISEKKALAKKAQRSNITTPLCVCSVLAIIITSLTTPHGQLQSWHLPKEYVHRLSWPWAWGERWEWIQLSLFGTETLNRFHVWLHLLNIFCILLPTWSAVLLKNTCRHICKTSDTIRLICENQDCICKCFFLGWKWGMWRPHLE